MIVENNKTVKVHYHGYFPDSKEVFDSSLEREPLSFTVGRGQMIPGFEAELLGSKLSEKRTFTLEPERAYGHRDETKIIEMPFSDFPEGIEVGMTFQAEVQGMPMPFEIISINSDSGDSGTVTCDFNHPMAGKALTFEVEVMEITEAAEDSHCCSDPGCSSNQ
ncbi:MAG: peptidylprolyl isomerase [Candidatus Poseidoniales archaeon]